MRHRQACCARLLTLASLLLPGSLQADTISVRHRQGAAHGFVALRTLEGKQIATGDVTATVRGDLVTARLLFQFRDGSIDEDTTIFSQNKVVRLISDHHIQRGPSFPKPIDMSIDVKSGQITSRGEDGKVTQEHLDLPDDVSNGLPPNLLLNILPTTPETKISFVAPTAKPRLIHVSIKPMGMVPFTIGGTRRKAVDYLLHIELGGSPGSSRLSSASSRATTTSGFSPAQRPRSSGKKGSYTRVARSGESSRSARVFLVKSER